MNCDSLAHWYRWLEYVGFGRELERRRKQFLPDLETAKRALVLGDGDGRFLAELLRVNPIVRVDYVDNSAQMLTLAFARVRANIANGLERVRFHHADAREWPLSHHAQYDLIATHFFLDCFAEGPLASLVGRVAAAAASQACWVVSDFHQPEEGFAAWRARLWIGALYAFFRVTTGLSVRRLSSYHAALREHGFRCESAVTANMGLLISELWRRS